MSAIYNYSVNPVPSGGGRRSWLRPASAEVWLKFLLALLGLGLAFCAALFSTASGEAGHLWASVLLASLALLLSAFVGLVTVPYLARRVAFERLRQTFRYEVAKAGVIYVLVTLVIGIAALNTGNNLLYIVVAAMLAALLASGVVSALVLRGLQLEVRLPEHVFAGSSVAAQIALRNTRRFLPSFSISVVPARQQERIRKQWRWEPTTFVFPTNRPAGSQWVKMRDWRVRRVELSPPPPGLFEGAVYFPYLPPGSHLTADLQLCFDRRGRYRESSFGVATRFPFAFLTKTRDVALEREILVYPGVEPAGEMLEIQPQVRGEWETFMRGRGSDLYRIREYMPEDSVRHVDWKASAKSGSLKVREFSSEEERKLRIVFDNPVAGILSDLEYERGVNLAASLAWRFSAENVEISFAVTGQTQCADVYEFLAQLAVIQPLLDRTASDRPGRDEASGSRFNSSRSADVLLQEAILSNAGEYNIILTARPRTSLPAAFLNCSQVVSLGHPAPIA